MWICLVKQKSWIILPHFRELILTSWRINLMDIKEGNWINIQSGKCSNEILKLIKKSFIFLKQFFNTKIYTKIRSITVNQKKSWTIDRDFVLSIKHFHDDSKLKAFQQSFYSRLIHFKFWLKSNNFTLQAFLKTCSRYIVILFRADLGLLQHPRWSALW